MARKALLLACAFVLTTGCNRTVHDERVYDGDIFRQNIRPTGPLTPEEELAGFQLPPGFEIQLFASEPDIDKPINMTFDAKGRMWVTQSFEYPFPTASGSRSTDRLTILEDTDNDGKADRFTEVSDTLNIPIGVLPMVDGVLNFSIPNVYRFVDTDGDDKPESKKTILGPFGFQDTHGMVSNFIRGYDGWVHACHGFTNFSAVAGTDGDSIKMTSGNTFRFKPDGSRVEQMTFGQVNPFGLAYDEYGYIYSTDSHSSPLYQLIRGGDYPHFAKREIMAFGPDMKSLEDEATALCGIAYYGDTKFPTEFQKNFFIGDALRSRVHRYSWKFEGSSPVGKSETDLVKSADPWFRPVNVKLGPDGAIYIADFYNAIIGHYEVPLAHPKRDKQRGRIWRITYKGQQNEKKDLSAATLTELLDALDEDNITLRMSAADQIADRIGSSAIPALSKILTDQNVPTLKYIHSLWLLYRLNALSDSQVQTAIDHVDPLVRLHGMRILRERGDDEHRFEPQVQKTLKDPDPHVRRASVELLNRYPNLNSVQAVLSVLHETPGSDTHLVYTGRLCLRNLLRHDTLMKEVASNEWNSEQAGFIAGTVVDVHSTAAAEFLRDHIANQSLPGEKTQLAYQQMGRFLPDNEVPGLIRSAQQKDADVEVQAFMFNGIQEGLAQRGGTGHTDQLALWGNDIAERLLKKYPNPSRDDSVLRSQRFAIQLAEDYKVKAVEPELKNLLRPSEGGEQATVQVKTEALRALLAIDSEENIHLAGQIVADSSVDIALRKNAAAALGEMPGPAVNKILSEITGTPADLEASIVAAMAGTSAGKEIIFEKVRKGEIKTRTLVDPRVEERMMLNILENQQKEYAALTSNVDPISEEREALIKERIAAYDAAGSTSLDAVAGQDLFNRNCGICHRSMNESGIGPQLHGIGKRGAEAIAEKIIDPNRNISEAFRNYTITLKDGKVMTGLFRREEGEVIVFGDLSGKEFSIPKNQIADQVASRYTIMPDYFGSTLSQGEFNNLLTYLLNY